MKVVSIVGVRPEFVQEAPVHRALYGRQTELLVHTGQHYDYLMSEVFFRQLGLPVPDYTLDVGSGSHAAQTGQMMAGIEEILVRERPDVVIVRGDTNSTLAGALAASKLKLKLAHIEAGLRSFDRRIPEEINRLLTDRVSDLLFCPTRTATRNLQKEGIRDGVHLVGDVMYDGILHNLAIAERESTIARSLRLEKGGYLLATVHRESNTNNPQNLQGIISALSSIGERVILPMHPRLRERLSRLQEPPGANVELIEPVGHFDMLALERDARLILTDSGGVQKEAYCVSTPCVTLRDSTEWVETVAAGWNVLVGADAERIRRAVGSMHLPRRHPDLYGDGHAAERIVKILEREIV